jgi:hypothetical protein
MITQENDSIKNYHPPITKIKLKKGEKLIDYSNSIKETHQYGENQNKEPYLSIELRKDQTFEDYIKEIEKMDAPFDREPPVKVEKGESQYIRRAHLFPVKSPNKEVAWRVNMPSDHGKFYDSGIGWKLNPTIFIILAVFLPGWIALPIFNLVFGSYDQFIASLIQETTINLSFIVLATILVLFTGYAIPRLEALVRPNEKTHKAVKMLFKDELEYLKFSRQIIWDVFDLKWLKLGVICLLLYQPIGLSSIYIPSLWINGNNGHLPHLCSFILIFSSLGLGLLIAFIMVFILAIFVALFHIGNLGKDRKKLSVYRYRKMISKISESLNKARLEEESLASLAVDLDTTGKTYYEFQRGNRQIGEFLFNIATILIVICITAGIVLFLIDLLNLLPETLAVNMTIIYVVIFIFGILSLGIFVLPQISIHKFLKDLKYRLVDNFSSLSSRLEFLYFESMVKPEILLKIDKSWESRKDIVEDIDLIKEMVKEVREYGTWSYDFPEVMKLIVVAGATIIPLLLPLLGTLLEPVLGSFGI